MPSVALQRRIQHSSPLLLDRIHLSRTDSVSSLTDSLVRSRTGWKELPGQQMRFASFQVSAEKPDVQLTVIPLGAEAGNLLDNVNRWEKQLGLPPTPQQDLGKIVKTMDVNGSQASVVDLAGPANANPPSFAASAASPGPTKSNIDPSTPPTLIGCDGCGSASFNGCSPT